MDNQIRCRWEVKDTVFSAWRTLPGELTAKEIWDMRKRGDFYLASGGPGCLDRISGSLSVELRVVDSSVRRMSMLFA
jgi:hypothetical protein